MLTCMVKHPKRLQRLQVHAHATKAIDTSAHLRGERNEEAKRNEAERNEEADRNEEAEGAQELLPPP